MTAGLGLEEVLLCFGAADPMTGDVREMALRFSYQPGAGVVREPHRRRPIEPLAPIDRLRPAQARRRAGAAPSTPTS